MTNHTLQKHLIFLHKKYTIPHMSNLSPYYTMLAGIGLGIASTFALAPVRKVADRAATYGINWLTDELTQKQETARQETQPEIYAAIDEAFKAKNAPDFIYLETADRLFFAKKGQPVIRLNLNNPESHYQQTRIKMMSPDEAYEYLKSVRGNKGINAHEGVSEYEESYYIEHAGMTCSDVRKRMTDPDTIRSTANVAIGNLKALMSEPDTPNKSDRSNIALLTGKKIPRGGKQQSIAYIKPFADNLREEFERDGVQYFDRIPAEEMYSSIKQYRENQLRMHVEQQEFRADVDQSVQNFSYS